MPELRKDPIIGRWVIVASERGKRPMDFPPRTPRPGNGFCPFCDGNEDKTPQEVLAFREGGEANGPGWNVRVVPNKFPALIIEGPLKRRGVGMYDKMDGIGAHEVIIDTPEHAVDFADLPLADMARVVEAYQLRQQDLSRDERFRYLLIFKNHGEEAGASLEHSHSQLIATPIVPKRVMEELEGAAWHFKHKERCIFCDIIDQEVFDRRRIIAENEAFLAIAPFAARFPFESWILPKRHEPHFFRLTADERPHFCEMLSTVLRKLNRALNRPAFNYVIHTAPVNERGEWHYHWHLELMPKLSKVAGFEWGSGFYINPTPPEQAAAFLRELELGDERPEAPAAR